MELTVEEISAVKTAVSVVHRTERVLMLVGVMAGKRLAIEVEELFASLRSEQINGEQKD